VARGRTKKRGPAHDNTCELIITVVVIKTLLSNGIHKKIVSKLLKVLTYWVASTKLINYQVVNTQWGHLPKIIALAESYY